MNVVPLQKASGAIWHLVSDLNEATKTATAAEGLLISQIIEQAHRIQLQISQVGEAAAFDNDRAAK